MPTPGRRLLTEHRVTIDVLLQGLTEALSPYAHTIAAAHERPLPVTDQEVRRAHRRRRKVHPRNLLDHNDLPRPYRPSRPREVRWPT
jgi:hypothetical protein